jgi:Spy/CpxP family protein refolding chaperone
MNKHRFVGQLAVASGFFFLCSAPWLTAGQSIPPSPQRAPQAASPAASQGNDAGETDPYAGMEFTPEQRAKIGQIHKEFKVKRETVIKDDKLDEDKKGAFITGLKRLENAEVMKVLTPEQQKVAKARDHSRREAQKAPARNPTPPKP